MKKRNIFSDKFEKKSSSQLRKVIKGEGFQQNARLAAIWELERRNEATDQQHQLAETIIAEEELKTANRLSAQRYHTFWLRSFASIIDGLVLWPVGVFFSFLSNSDFGALVILGNMLNNLSPYFYSVVLHGLNGQTIGKKAMGVRVVDNNSEGKINLKQAFIRDSVPIALIVIFYAYSPIIFFGYNEYDRQTNYSVLIPVYLMGGLTFFWSILEIFSMLFNDKSRAVHDLIARTVVVKT